MVLRIKNYAKLLKGFISLWVLLLLFTTVHKSPVKVEGDTNKDDKGKFISSTQQDTDQNSFLFVDCTGFFE